MVVLTARCNLACSYCWQSARSPARMSWPTLRAAVDHLLASRAAEIHLTFTGGEPLLERPLLRRAVARVERRRRPGQRILLELFTNGLLLDAEAATFLVAHDVAVQLSFDGVPAAQALRGAGTFERLDRLLDRLRGDYPAWYGRRLAVAVTVLPSTLESLAESVRYLVDKQVQEIRVSPCLIGLSDWRPERIGEIERALRALFDLCDEHFERTGRVPVGLFAGAARAAPPPVAGQAICGAASTASLTVDADGEVVGCPLFAESAQRLPADWLAARLHQLRLGGIDAPELGRRLADHPERARGAEILHHPERRYSSFSACQECEHRGACRICPVASAHLAGNRDPYRVPDFLCAFHRVRLDLGRHRPPLPDALDILRGTQRVPARLEMLRRLVQGNG